MRSRNPSPILMISLAGLPGFATAAGLVEAWGRKPTCVLMLLGSAVCAYLYGHAGSQLIAFGLGMQFFLFGMWSALYAYTTGALSDARTRDRCRMCFGNRPSGCVDRALRCGRCAALLGPARCICPRCRVVCRCYSGSKWRE